MGSIVDVGIKISYVGIPLFQIKFEVKVVKHNLSTE